MADYSLADVAAAAGNENGFGNGGWILILLFAMIFGGGNGFFGNRDGFGQYATAASQQEILFGQQFQNLDNKMDRIGNGIADATFALNNSINNVGGQVANCCCTTQRAIDGVNYNGAINTAAINANTTAQTQRILDAMCEAENARLRDRIQTLELKEAMCGVVRYPQTFAYNAGANPFCGCGNAANI